jgi:hypothetical protein
VEFGRGVVVVDGDRPPAACEGRSPKGTAWITAALPSLRLTVITYLWTIECLCRKLPR